MKIKVYSSTSYFNEHYDLSRLSDTEIDKLAQKLVNADILLDYNILAIRSVEPEYASELRHSHVWEDNEMLDEELDGVSALALHTDRYDFDDVQSLAEDLKQVLSRSISIYAIQGYKPFLIAGNSGYGGEDIGEVIVSDPEIIDLKNI